MEDNVATIPTRAEVAPEDSWNLSRLYPEDGAWEEDFARFKEITQKIPSLKGTLGESADSLAKAMGLLNEVRQLEERLGYYAHLRLAEDQTENANQDRYGRLVKVASEADSLASFVAPEIQSIPDDKIESYLEDSRLADYRIYLRKLLRFKPHILSEAEERLLALQEEANMTAQKGFAALTDADFDFGTVDTPEGKRALSQGSYNSFQQHADRGVRERSYRQFMGVYDGHKHTLANLYSGSVSLDVYKARIRNYDSSLASRLFPDKVPEEVYRGLIEAVHAGLPVLHRYYGLRRRALGLEELRHFDTKVPLVPDITMHHTYDAAVDRVCNALSPLGDEYVETLRGGLLGGWVDRYENKGKRSGAFSAGNYFGDPYILMNFQADDLRDVFTLAHEAGHSMHSFYSVRANPFPQYNYTIFEAEVASTFNEQLLYAAFQEELSDPQARLYLINRQIDDIIGTLYRQTMFAEYELKTHELAESGHPLTLDLLRQEYRKLLEHYFGPEMIFDEVSDLEGLRIPHFYRAFYVYKYATGIAAAIQLAERVVAGGAEERDAYFRFLSSGGSRFPLESLGAAGVDVASGEPVRRATELFATLVNQLEIGLGV
jgi:oligoendopeptidase F